MGDVIPFDRLRRGMEVPRRKPRESLTERAERMLGKPRASDLLVESYHPRDDGPDAA
jgi:hypothetical protein